MSQTVTEQISPTDWKDTPPAIQRILLSFQHEINTMRERVERIEQKHDAHPSGLERYHTLVEQQFSHGLTPEQKEEIERLGKEIDEANSLSYPSLKSLAEAATPKTKRGWKAIAGTFADDPLYDEAMQLGREWRENQFDAFDEKTP